MLLAICPFIAAALGALLAMWSADRDLRRIKARMDVEIQRVPPGLERLQILTEEQSQAREQELEQAMLHRLAYGEPRAPVSRTRRG